MCSQRAAESVPQFQEHRSHIEQLLNAALSAADARAAVTRNLRLGGDELIVKGERLTLDTGTRIILIAAGKAATAMSRGALDVLGSRISHGIVIHPEGESCDPEWHPELARIAGGHPLPNENSVAAGGAIAALLANAVQGEWILILLSGGASAMMELPIAGVSIEELAELTSALQRAGCDINELNCVRRAVSRLKGGGLLRLAVSGRVVALLLSDVVGNDPATIASGPVVASPTGVAEAETVLARYGLAEKFAQIVRSLRAVSFSRTVPPAFVVVVGSNEMAAAALRSSAEQLGFQARIVTNRMNGEASEVGKTIAQAALRLRQIAPSSALPACLIYGGETTVTVHGSGQGGRNQELVLGAACVLDGVANIAICSFATDGIDGASRAAGAIATGTTVKRAGSLGLSAARAFASNDSAPFFAALGDSIHTGPTGTNVNDLAIALIYRSP